MIFSSYELGHAGDRRLRVGQDLQIEDLFLLAAEHREDAVRRQLVQRLAEIEIVLEFLAFGLLAACARWRPSARSTTSARAAPPIRSASSAKRSTRIARAPSSAAATSATCLSASTNARGHRLRIVLRLRQQQFGQRLEPGLPGDLGLGAALRLERQIDVLQPPLAVGGEDRRFQRGIELALFADRIRGSRCGAPRVRADRSGALPACAIARRRARR